MEFTQPHSDDRLSDRQLVGSVEGRQRPAAEDRAGRVGHELEWGPSHAQGAHTRLSLDSVDPAAYEASAVLAKTAFRAVWPLSKLNEFSSKKLSLYAVVLV